ncbi:hypothetical protein AB6A40_004791 [Gnathostoma spinigerum]|uniref:Uncharacterized protein n=1 Tax=Gnathostoma spinigerum TaxID=75299 RepID=A0ABD6ENF9_9BILA
MSFTQFAVWPASQAVEEYHYCHLAGGKLWLFSRKFVDQPKFSYGHRVAFTGGYVMYLDLSSKKWSGKMEFPAISTEENMEESIFVLGSDIYILLHTGFGGVTFKQLLRWNEEKSAWTPVAHFTVDPGCNTSSSSAETRCDCFVAVQSDSVKDSICIVTSVDGKLALHNLSISGTTARLSPIRPPDAVAESHMKSPVKAARWDDKVYVIYGEHGCGFHIEPMKWTCIKEDTKETFVCDLQGEKPPFSFQGARGTGVLASGLWVHIIGSTSKGMGESTYNGEIWTADLKQCPLTWKKCSLVAPKLNSEENIVAVSGAGEIYVGDKANGILHAKI